GSKATSAAAPAIRTSWRPFWRAPPPSTQAGRGSDMASDTGIGAAILRKEDRRFLSGRGTYVSDVKRPNMTWAAFARSPHAHARLNGIDSSAALQVPGVLM